MSDFRFESSEYLALFWLIPILYFLSRYFQKRNQRTLQKGLGQRLLPFLMSSVSDSKKRFKSYIEFFVLALIVLALARPQNGEGRQQVKNEGIELAILFDVSNSMLAEDAKPSRLQLAKSELERFIDMSPGDRMALVAFAGSATLLSPLTQDQSAIKMYIDSISPISVSNQGTDFSKALSEAKAAFGRGGIGDQQGSQVTQAILIISDGEDHEVGAYEVAKDLIKDGVRIFTLAVGTEVGAPIPIYDENGNLRGTKTDRSGKEVLSATSGTVLKELASIGKGSFHQLSFQSDAVTAVREEINDLKKAQYESGEVSSYDENYQYLLFLAFILACFEILIGDRKPKGRIWKGRFEIAQD